jgi:hypothetical protein
VAPQVDADGAEDVAQPPRQRVEQAGTEPVGVEEQEGYAICTPVEDGDAQPVVLDRDLVGIAQAGSEASRAPSFSS